MLKDITIVIPTFHRRGYLAECFPAVEANLPECSVVVAQDDGGDCTLEYNTYWAKLPYDSGLTAKRNAAVRLVETPYVLMGSDDFDFSETETRWGIIEMAAVLRQCPAVDVVVGRYKDQDYHGFLEYVPGKYIKEHRLDMNKQIPNREKFPPFWRVDIGPNYFLARTEVLKEIPWDETIRPIGGEHASWFLDLKAANKMVVYLPYANINEQPRDRSKEHPNYREFRARCWDGHNLMKKKRNITQYIDFNGGIS
jgi:hypothetical protein